MHANRSMLPHALILLACSLTASVLSGQDKTPVKPTDSAVELDTFKISIAHVWKIEAAFLKAKRKRIPDYKPSDRDRTSLRRGIALQALEMKLLSKFVKTKGLTVTPEDEAKRLKQFKEGLKSKNKSFQEALEELGQSESEFNTINKTLLALENMIEPTITDTEVRAAYKKIEMKLPLRKCSEILFAYKGSLRSEALRSKSEAQKLAEDTLKKFRTPDTTLTFSTYAKAHSDSPSRRNLGDLGFIPMEGPMVKSFSNALYQLPKIGAISELVETDFGYHLIQLTELKSFGTYEKRLRQGLLRKKFDGFMQQFRLSNFDKVRVNQKLLEKNPG